MHRSHSKSPVQVNIFQKLEKHAVHVLGQNCSECQNKTKTTICVHNMFCRHSELTIFMKNEQSVVTLHCGFVDSIIRASDKDLPVRMTGIKVKILNAILIQIGCHYLLLFFSDYRLI